MTVVSVCWRRVRLAFVLSASAALGACAMTSFTQGYRQNYAISDDEVRQIQFYTSEEIVLERTSALQERGNVGTAFSIQSKTTLREVVIAKGTPAVVLQVVHEPAGVAAEGGEGASPEVEYLQVGFSPNDPRKSLWFSTLRSKVSGRYELTHVVGSAASESHESPTLSPGFLVRYDGHDYRVRDQAMWQAHLCFDQDFTAHEEVDRVSPPGWRLPAARHGKASPAQ
jgi:hypothetical protein